MYLFGVSSAHSGVGAFYSSGQGGGELQLSPPVMALGREDARLEVGKNRPQTSSLQVAVAPKGLRAFLSAGRSAKGLHFSVKRALNKEAGPGKSESLRMQEGEGDVSSE